MPLGTTRTYRPGKVVAAGLPNDDGEAAGAQLRKHDAAKKRGEIGSLKPAFLVRPKQDLRGAALSALSKGIKETYDTTKDPTVYKQRVGLGAR